MLALSLRIPKSPTSLTIAIQPSAPLSLFFFSFLPCPFFFCSFSLFCSFFPAIFYSVNQHKRISTIGKVNTCTKLALVQRQSHTGTENKKVNCSWVPFKFILDNKVLLIQQLYRLLCLCKHYVLFWSQHLWYLSGGPNLYLPLAIGWGSTWVHIYSYFSFGATSHRSNTGVFVFFLRLHDLNSNSPGPKFET